jgi:hypothetical protein
MEDVRTQLQTARERLAAFEEASSRDHLLARLRAQSPGHPLILGRNAAAFGAMGLVLTSLVSMSLPILDIDTAKRVNAIDTALGFPLAVALVVLAVCGLAMAVALHQLALGAARNAALLPEEAKKHQRLVADVKQLESRLAMEGTPRPVVRVNH